MTNINLLPPEILGKRRAERILVYSFVGIVVLVFILFFVYTINAWVIGQEERELSAIKIENQKLEEVIAEYEIYEKKKAEVEKWEGILKTAMEGEVSWSKLLNEISMVIPSDVWLTSFKGDMNAGINFQGYTFTHNSVAKWMVRLKEIKHLTEIWLNASEKTEVEEQEAIQFETTSQLKTAKPSVPAPPRNSGE
ncbi:MAG: PilN domain-containing protein [Actinomycetota bacterium]